MNIYEVYQLAFIDGDGASFTEHRSTTVYLTSEMAKQKCEELKAVYNDWWDIRVVTLRVV